MRFISEKVENLVEEPENTVYKHFYSFPTKKRFFPRSYVENFRQQKKKL